MGQLSTQSRSAIAIPNVLSCPPWMPVVIEPCSHSHQHASWVSQHFSCSSAAASAHQLPLKPLQWLQHLIPSGQRFLTRRTKMRGTSITLVRNTKSQDPPQTNWIRNSGCGDQQAICGSEQAVWVIVMNADLENRCVSWALFCWPDGFLCKNPIVTFLPGTDPLVTCKIRSVSSARFMEWSVVLFTNISSSPALPCPFDVSCAHVFDLA